MRISRITPIELNEEKIRPMGELEIQGAILYLQHVISHDSIGRYGATDITFDDVDESCYYDMQTNLVQVVEKYLIADAEGDYCYVDYMFMVENSSDVLLAKVIYNDYDSDEFCEEFDDGYKSGIVRFDV